MLTTIAFATLYWAYVQPASLPGQLRASHHTSLPSLAAATFVSTIPSAHQPQPPSQRFAAFTYATRSPASHGKVHGQPLPTLHLRKEGRIDPEEVEPMIGTRLAPE